MAPRTNQAIAKELRRIAEEGITEDWQRKLLEEAAGRIERKGHRKSKQGHTVLYTVWDNRTDKCIAIDLPGKQCAEIMGIEYNSFLVAMMRGSDKWTIEKRLFDSDVD